MITLKPQIHLIPSQFTSSPSSAPILIQIGSKSQENPTNFPALKNSSASSSFKKTHTENPRNLENPQKFSEKPDQKSRALMWGAAAVGAAVLLVGLGEEEKALALGPGGPLMEDFWENMRRYGVFALTVSTGALYAVFRPIFELLRSPVSAILVVLIVAGGFYIMSQVLSAMLGIS
ncbi:hypothetical protein DM860_000584 [Cuscuta australis]|uniref:Uncharacterized protein ycf33 n=1 Tax=Cuscuta australis TaxID=267555 RepID=A0A328CYY8_9ASTE|nr:hypothetical protein DM860_000584 [Cuscuta australis]